MRKACLLGIHELARQDERVVFIGSDITKRNLEDFSDEFPDRFFMEGIYEAHIIGMSAGLAMCGKVPYINTIATFLTRRCYEQVIVDLGLHQLPVRLIGSGGGTVYAPLGPTHLANEDIAILRAIPNMTIIAPCDADEMNRLLPKTLHWNGPLYIRLAKGGDRIVSRDDIPYEIGKAISLKEGNDVLFLTTGITTQIALDAGVLHIHTIKPLDVDEILKRASSVKAVISVEEHTVMGGLGSAAAEVFMESNVNTQFQFKRIGFPDIFTDELGSQIEIMEKYGMSPDGLCKTALRMLS